MKHQQRRREMACGDIRDPWGKELGKLPALVLPRLNGNPPKDAGAGSPRTHAGDCWLSSPSAENSGGSQPWGPRSSSAPGGQRGSGGGSLAAGPGSPLETKLSGFREAETPTPLPPAVLRGVCWRDRGGSDQVGPGSVPVPAAIGA